MAGSVAAASAGSAPAAVTVGQLAPGLITSCSNSFEWVQVSAPDNAYTVPAAGEITSWTHRSQVGAGQTPTLKIYRKIGDPATFVVVGRDGPHPIAANTIATFSARIAVKAGDVLGLTGAGGASNIGCKFPGPGESGFLMNNLADGQQGAFTGSPDSRLNVSASLNPTNTFALGGITRNRKKGTATITAEVPNPGQLTASGTGVKAAGVAVISAIATGPGKVKLLIRAKGKQKRKLRRTGKVKLAVTIIYTPAGGEASTQLTRLKLKKKL